MARRDPKRKQKKREKARTQSGSPYRLIGSTGELVACYINLAWKEDGKASIYVLRRMPRGGHAMGMYLVDLWCLGLKDAAGHLDISYAEFRDMLERVPAEIELVRVELETVRRMVAGGIRFALENGFRLPPRYERWVALLGPDVGPDEADLSDFGVDGKLRYVGPLEDLERRLIDGRAEAFLEREDVDYIVGDDPLLAPDENLEAVELVTETIREKGLAAVRQWCFAHGEVPHARLSDAWDIMMEALMQMPAAPEEDEELDDEVFADINERMATLMSFEGDQAEHETQVALGQIARFMREFDSPDAMIAALGIDEALDDVDERS